MYKTINKTFFDVFSQPQKKKLIYGGAGSGKSISIAQHFCHKLCTEKGVRLLVLRKYFPSMRVSTYLVIKSILADWGINFKDQKTEHFIEVGDSRLYYLSLDSSEKIKGGEFKYIWMEEATEFTEDDYKQLSIRLARDKKSEDVTLFLSFNPIDQGHWCVKLLDQARNDPKTFLVHHSTYKDNVKNLSQSFIKELEDLKNTDENFYRVYNLGEPGVLRHKIYNHFIIEDSNKWPWNHLNKSVHCYGLDFGWNHPMALCEVFYYENEFYVRELFYRRECTTDDLAVWMQHNKVDHNAYIYADSAEPDRIQTLNTTRMVTSSIIGREITTRVNRFNVFPAKKDVKAGIDFIKSKKVHLCSQAANAIKEVQNYKYKTTRDGDVIEEPVKAWDDFLDSFRYATFSLKLDSCTSIPAGMSKGYSFSTGLSVEKFRL